jgi:hypothetical protein
MDNPACCVVHIDVLTSGAARPHKLELQIRVENFKAGVVRKLGQNRYAAGAKINRNINPLYGIEVRKC